MMCGWPAGGARATGATARVCLWLLLVFCLSACTQHVVVAYPATSAGETLRRFYEAPDAKLQEFSRPLYDIQDHAVRDSLKPAMLSIIARDDSIKGFCIANILYDWDRDLLATAVEFRHLAPALAQGLRNGNYLPMDPPRASAVASTLMLGCMNREAAYPIRRDMYACFNAPLRTPIEGESNDCYTRYLLALMIPTFGEEGIAQVARGLDNRDPLMRAFALNGLTGTGSLSLTKGWAISEQQLAAQRASARRYLPRIIELVSDKNGQVTQAALEALVVVVKPSDATSQLIAKLRNLAENDADTMVRKRAQEVVDEINGAKLPVKVGE